ncbi:12702_t:CDS:10 [Rhizophagus irregularis]|nr:12702_t:CDS:10 [Rhizophagus irregularis]
MEPETFINLLLDHIESKAVISTDYNYLYLHKWEIAPEIAARLPRSSLELLIKQALDDSRVPGQTIHWLLIFIRDQAGWLYSSNNDADSKEIQRRDDFRAFLAEKFSRMSRTLLYEDLELLRMVQGISKINDIKVKPDFTQEEMLVSQKLHVCQAILDTVILFPSEHRTHQLDLCKDLEELERVVDSLMNSNQQLSQILTFKIYKAEYPCQTDLLINQLRLEKLITIQEVESLKLKPFLKTLMYNNIVNECLEHLELFELELAQCLKNNQDISSEFEYFDLLAKRKTELNSIYETFSTLKNKEIILILLDIAEFVINVPAKFMMRVIISLALLHRLCSEKHNTQCNISNDSNVNKVTYQIVFHDINFKEINRLILDIWLSSFSRLRISRSFLTYQINSSETLKMLQILTTLFLFTFYASSRFTWIQSYTNPIDEEEDKTEILSPTLALFLENLVKLFKVLLNNDLCEERKSIEDLIHIIFDKLGFEVPLEVIIKESKYLLKVVETDPWTDLLKERIGNVNQEESM